MKKIIRILSISIPLALITILSIRLICNHLNQEQPPLIKTERITKRALSQSVTASGDLDIKNPIKLGSIISGLVKDLYVTENEIVSEGQLLMTVDPGTGDTDFEQAFNDYLRTQKEYLYKKSNFTRKAALYKADQLSRDEYELIEKDMYAAEYTFKSAKAKLDREKMLLSERNIFAPQAGCITKITISKGSGVVGSNVAASEPLIEIAPDFTTMEIKLNIDESDVSSICIDQKIKVTFNAYPDQQVFTKVKDIGFSAKKIDGMQYYKVCADLHNPEKKFRPGMLFNAKIYIAEKEVAPCIHGFAFQINPKNITTLANKLGYAIKPLEKAERKKIKETNHTKRVKFVWVKEGKSFVQKPVIIGITDDNFFEVLEGITESDEVVTEIAEEDQMSSVYKKWFSGPL